MATQWFCRLMGEDLGPFSSRDMVELVRKRKLTQEDMIRKGLDGSWVPAYLVQGLFDAAGNSEKNAAGSDSARTTEGTSKVHAKHTDMPSPAGLSGLLSAILLGHRQDTAEKKKPGSQVSSDAQAIRSAHTDRRGEDPGPESRQWFCVSGGERRGPMTLDELKSIAASGRLKPHDRVWSTHCPRWSHANEIPDLVFS